MCSRVTTKSTEPEKVIIGFKFHTQVRFRVHHIVIPRVLDHLFAQRRSRNAAIDNVYCERQCCKQAYPGQTLVFRGMERVSVATGG